MESKLALPCHNCDYLWLHQVTASPESRSGGEEESPSPCDLLLHPARFGESCSKIRLFLLPAQRQCLLLRPEPKGFHKPWPSVSESYWNQGVERGWGGVATRKVIFHQCLAVINLCLRSRNQIPAPRAHVKGKLNFVFIPPGPFTHRLIWEGIAWPFPLCIYFPV